MKFIPWYLVEVERRLAPYVETQRLLDTLREVETHLHERTNEFIANGIEPVRAERLAVEAFGCPRQFADSVIGESDARPQSQTFFYIALGAVALGSLMVIPYGIFGNVLTQIPALLIVVVGLVSAVLTRVFDFRAAAWTLAGTLAVGFLLGGSWFLMDQASAVSRAGAVRVQEETLRSLAVLDADRKLYSVGKAFYAQDPLPTQTPAALVEGSRFRVPRSPRIRYSGYRYGEPYDSLFQSQNQRFAWEGPVSTRAEARSLWRKANFGSYMDSQGALLRQRLDSNPFDQSPGPFSAQAGLMTTSTVLPLSLLGMGTLAVVQWTSVRIGRWRRRKRRLQLV